MNSTSTQAVTASGNGKVSADEIDARGVEATGHASVHDSDNVFTYSPTADPLASLPVPGIPAIVRSSHALNISGGQVTLQPGLYVGGIKISGHAEVTLAPGIYYLQGGGFSVSSGATVSGTEVMLYNAATGAVTPSPSTAAATSI